MSDVCIINVASADVFYLAEFVVENDIDKVVSTVERPCFRPIEQIGSCRYVFQLSLEAKVVEVRAELNVGKVFVLNEYATKV